MKIRKYELLEQIGEGGMGVVHKACDTELGRTVAIKAIHEELLRKPEIRKRFIDEARVQAKLAHQNICTLYDAFDEDGKLYLVQEYVEGTTVKHMLDEAGGPLPFERAIEIARGVLSGLAHAHEEGVIHRDIKPSNVMVDLKGRVKIMDFGIAKALGGERLGKTKTGTAVGTPEYMSPEQILGKDVDARSDIYSVGMMLFEILTGKLPFEHTTSEYEIQKFHVEGVVPMLGTLNQDVPAWLNDIVQKFLAKRPDDRYKSADDGMHALTERQSSKVTVTMPPALMPSQSGIEQNSKVGRYIIWVCVSVVLAGCLLSAMVKIGRARSAAPERNRQTIAKREEQQLENNDGASRVFGPLASNTVVALVNGKEVVAGQIEALIQQAVAQKQQMGMPVTPAQLDQERKKLIDQRIMDVLVRDVLATSDVQVAEVQVDRQIASLISNEYNGEGQLREALEESNMTYDQFREGLRLQLKVMALVQRDMILVTSTVAEAQQYYANNRADFAFPEQATVAHILLAVPPNASANTIAKTLARLRTIRQEIKKGMSFAEAAKKYSQDASAARGGLLGVLDRNQTELPAPFLDAVFAAPLRNVTDTVATDRGYHLLYVTDKKPARTASFDEVKSEIMQGIDLGRRQQMLQQWAQKLRENATVIYK